VRELQNCIERAVALTGFEEIAPGDLPDRVLDPHPRDGVPAGDDPSELLTMEELEKRYIARVLVAVGGNRSHAARVLGFDRKTLYRKLGQYRLEG
jgi:DNA-binding NtrC family response regulator